MATGILPAALILVSAANAQAPPPEFEAASVKMSAPGSEYGGVRGGPGSISPGQIIYTGATLRAVTAMAYGVQRFQIAGPPWLDQQRYDIAAKLPLKTTTPEFRLMLQKLLADRFKMEVRRENRTQTVYDITIAKSGLKMAKAPDEEGKAPSETAPPIGAGVFESYFDGKAQLIGQHVTMRQLGVWLNQLTDRPVVDKTALSGRYDFTIPWSEGMEMDAGDGPAEPGAASEPRETIYAAFQKYLGLDLVKRKEPVETLVIVSLERVPTAN